MSAPSTPTPAAVVAAKPAVAPAVAPAAAHSTSASPAAPAAAPVVASPAALVRNVMSSVDQTKTTVTASTRQAKVFWNEQIAKPFNQQARVANVEFQKVRRDYPGPVIAAVTGSVFLLSAISGRGSFRTLRNTTFAALGTSLTMSPALTIGTLAMLRDRLATAAGYNRPSTVIVQQPIVAPTPTPNTTPAAAAPTQAKKQ